MRRFEYHRSETISIGVSLPIFSADR